MRVLLCLLGFVSVISLTGAAGAAGYSAAYFKLQPRIDRMEEERTAYRTLTNQSVNMSVKSLAFAQEYQEVLNTCLVRLYAGPTMEPVIFAGKGGIGGPIDARKPSRLP